MVQDGAQMCWQVKITVKAKVKTMTVTQDDISLGFTLRAAVKDRLNEHWFREHVSSIRFQRPKKPSIHSRYATCLGQNQRPGKANR